jgi:hypothetical protein
LTPQQRSRRARIAAHASWANTADRAGRTAAATASFLARFERQVDPLGVLEPGVREQMALHARRAYNAATRGALRQGPPEGGRRGGTRQPISFRPGDRSSEGLRRAILDTRMGLTS